MKISRGKTLGNLEFCRPTKSIEVSGHRYEAQDRKENRKSGEREKVWGRRQLIQPAPGPDLGAASMPRRVGHVPCVIVRIFWCSRKLDIPAIFSITIILSSFNSAQCPKLSLRSTRCSGCRARLGASLPSFMYADLSHGSGRTV